jgi:hypothetical protein
VTRGAYLVWIENLRQTYGFEERKVVAEIKRRLGIQA